MDFDFRTADGGYILELTSEFEVARLGEIWQRIQSERSEDGFGFGVIDFGDRDLPDLDAWELTAETVEMLHPAARMVTATVQEGFRFAVVSTRRILDPVIDDVRSLADLRVAGSPRRVADLRRFDDLDSALAWCRAGVAAPHGTTVRE